MCLSFPCKNQSPVSPSLFSVSMWRMDCRGDAVPWTPRPAPALVRSNRPTFLTASGGNPSCTAPIRTLTSHPKVHPGTPPPPVICKFRRASVTVSPRYHLAASGSQQTCFWGDLLLTSRYYVASAQGYSRSLWAYTRFFHRLK